MECIICREEDNIQLIQVCPICITIWYHKECFENWIMANIVRNKKCFICRQPLNITVTYEANARLKKYLCKLWLATIIFFGTLIFLLRPSEKSLPILVIMVLYYTTAIPILYMRHRRTRPNHLEVIQLHYDYVTATGN